MGVPLLTKNGSSFVSRTTQSVNCNIGMSDWVAENENEYISKAIEFSKKFSQLSEIRKRILLTSLESPLFNSPLFAEQFKNLVLKIWLKFINNNVSKKTKF